MSLKIHPIDQSGLLPMPEVPDEHGARNDEEKRVFKLIKDGLESGPAIAVDDTFFDRLRSRLSPKT